MGKPRRGSQNRPKISFRYHPFYEEEVALNFRIYKIISIEREKTSTHKFGVAYVNRINTPKGKRGENRREGKKYLSAPKGPKNLLQIIPVRIVREEEISIEYIRACEGMVLFIKKMVNSVDVKCQRSCSRSIHFNCEHSVQYFWVDRDKIDPAWHQKFGRSVL